MSINYLPFSLVVEANITKFTNFSAKESFQTLLILGASSDEAQREKVAEYSSYSEADRDNATDSVKEAISVVFSQQVRPKSIKVAYIDNSAPIEDELNRISAIDSKWVFLGILDEITNSDIDKGVTLSSWAGANKKIIGLIDKNLDALDKNQISLTQKLRDNNFNRAFAVFARNDRQSSSMFAILGYMATRNFDNPKSFYDAKFKSFSGVEAVSLTTTEYKNLTGFVPGQGIDRSVGNLGNVFTYIGDRAIFTEGTCANGELLGVEHAMLWLEYTIQYEVMNVFTNNAVVPYSDKGVGMLVSALKKSLDLAVLAGIIPKSGYSIFAQDVLDVPESRRANHIAPAIRWEARLNGAIHYSAIDGEVRY